MVKPTSRKRVLFRHSRKPIRLVVFGVFLFSTILTSVITAVNPIPAQAATTSTLTFQARLQTAGGAIVPDGYYNIEFKLYNASTSSGSSQGSCSGDANCVWTETYYDSNGVTAGNDNRVRVRNGYLTVNLASLTAFGGTINWDQGLWIGLNIGGSTQTATPTYDGEMTPRLKLTAVPYAFRAAELAKFGGTYTSTLGLTSPTVGNQSFLLPDMAAAGTFTLLNNVNGIQNQDATPQSARFNLVGTATGVNVAKLQALGSATAATMAIQQASSQTGWLLELQNTGGTRMGGIDSGGGFVTTGILKTLDKTTGPSNDLVLRSGNATTSGNTGNLTLDVGLATSGTNGTIQIGGVVDTAITLGHATGTGAITLGQSTASNTISIGNGNTANGNTQTINIGAGTPAGTGKATVTIGNTANASGVTVNAGSSGIALNGDTTVAGGKSLTMAAGIGTFTQTYNSTGAGSASTIALTNGSGTNTNGLLVNRNAGSGTTTNGVNITNTAGTLTNGLNFSGTIGTDIQRGTGTLTLNGASGVDLKANGTTIAGVSTTALNVAANMNLAMTAGTGVFTQSFNTAGAGTAATYTLSNTSGTQTNGILVDRNGASGTTTNGININQTAGTLTNGLAFTGTIGTDIQRSSGTLNINGASGINLKSNGTTTFSLSSTGAALLQNTSDSATALQVLKSSGAGGAAMFTVDTSNNAVIIGKVAGGTAAAAALYFGDTCTNFTQTCLKIGEYNGTDTDNLQLHGAAGLTFTTGYATQTVTGALTSTGRLGVGIGNSSPSAALHVTGVTGSVDLLRVTDSTATAADVMTIADEGSTTFQNRTDSTTAFQVKNSGGAGGSTVLGVDTTNKIVNTGGDLNVGSAANRSAGRLMSDGFESGNFKLWSNGASTGGSSTVTADTTIVHNGKYSMKSINNNGASIVNTVTGSATTASARAWVYVSSQTSGSADLVTLGAGANNFTLFRDSATGKLSVWNSVTSTGTVGSTVMSTGAWHQIEILTTINASTGSITAYLDGTAVVTLTSINTGSTAIGGYQIGDSNASRAHTAYYDDFVVDTVRPGDSTSLNVNDSLHVAGTTTFGGGMMLQTAGNTAAALQVQNSGGSKIMTVDTSNNQVTLGEGSAVQGKLVFFGSAGGNSVSILGPSSNPASSFTLTLPSTIAGNNQCLTSGTVSGGNVPLAFASCGSSTLQGAYDGSGGTANPHIQLATGNAGLKIRDNATPLTGNLFQIQNSGGTVTHFGVSTSTMTLQNTSGVNAMVFTTSGSVGHLQVIDQASSTQYADIYYDNANDEAVYGAVNGTARLGNGSGNILVQLSAAADTFQASKTVSLAGALSSNDFTFSRAITAGANSLTGAVVKIESTSTGSSTLASNILLLNENNAAATGNLIMGQKNGSQVFKVAATGAITGSAGMDISGGTVSINTSGSSGVNIGTGSYSGALALGNSSSTLNIQTSGYTVDTAGNMAGIGSIASDNYYRSDFTGTDALRVRNGGGTVGLLAIDTNATSGASGYNIQLGSATTDANVIRLILDSYNNSTDPTGVNGAIYYNSSLAKFRCYEAGAWKDCISYWSTLVKTADQSKTTDTTLANDNTLAFTMAASTKYSIRCDIHYETGATPDFKFATTGPGSPTLVRTQRHDILPTTTAYANIAIDTAATASTSLAGSAGAGFISMNTIWQNGANSATWAFQWAQNTSNGTAATVRAGSYCDYMNY